MTDEDGLRLEAAEQFGIRVQEIEHDETLYIATEAELIAFAKACERAGMFQAYGMSSRDLVAKRIAEIDAELAPLLERKPPSTSTLAGLHQRALKAVKAFYDAASYEETMWTGWGDCIVPPYAEMRRVKAEQSFCALRDAQNSGVAS